MKPVYIDQGCKIDNGLSIGAYASPTLSGLNNRASGREYYSKQ